ncbi:MAG: hypothetical protein GX781_06110 [Clostridiales bacterium]|nr:hypothetical protein [Clostridiales bacterium]
MMHLPPEEKKNSLISRSKDLIDSAVSGFKGRDMNALVDEFTQEMTVVAEGLSEELMQTKQQLSQLSAAQTITEEQRSQDMIDVRNRLKDIEKRLDTLSRQKDKQDRKRSSLSAILSQITLIAAIIAGAWVITAVLQLIRR